ncbi:MAG: hypothetical protein MMC23_004415 [Stictis urceolatum]|nr:hypothetical protein [Stictis urceolata]
MASVKRKPVRESPTTPPSTTMPSFADTNLDLQLSAPRNTDYDTEYSPHYDSYDREEIEPSPSRSHPSPTYEEQDVSDQSLPTKESIVRIESEPISEKVRRPTMPDFSKSAAELFTEGSIADDTTKVERFQEKAREARHTWDKWHLHIRSKGKRSRKEQVARDLYHKHLESEFGGGTGYHMRWPYKYQKPTKDYQDLEAQLSGPAISQSGAKKPFLNPLGQEIWKYEDVDTYLSPSKSVPRRLMVQATSTILKQPPEASWRRTKIRGSVPIALQLAEWAFKPSHWWARWFRCILVALPLQGLLALPGAEAPWEMLNIDDDYVEYTGYHWKWAKHAINPLDMRSTGKIYEKPTLEVSSMHRLTRPRQLMVHMKGTWILATEPPKDLQYIFISYHWGSFNQKKNGLRHAEHMARHIAEKHGIPAYFLDHKCNAPSGDLLTSDVNRMCDVIRGSRFLAILLPDDQRHRKTDWGKRMWTVPEGLLAPADIRVYTWMGHDSYKERIMGKVELTSEFWLDSEELRILAEHYQGSITLSRLGLFSSAISALSHRTTTKDHTGADMGYALMGLLQYRIDPDPSDDLFQVIARLSLANDNDRLIERMVSMFPSSRNGGDLFKTLAMKDQYDTKLWDIKPRCQVVGVADEPNTIILDECRAVPIRWKCFPRMMYKRHVGFKKRLAELAIRSGAWWTVSAYTLALTTYAPLLLAINSASREPVNSRFIWGVLCLLLGIGIILSAFAPKCVKRLFGGEVLQSAPHLIGFEGVMPKAQLEKIVFGNSEGRLDYEPSSTPFGKECKHPYVRKGREPDWIKEKRPWDAPGLLSDHRLFTLVDTGNMSISIFQAKHPPTVAVITGAEGGMLRAVLCSWRFADDCLYKETVMRLPTSAWSQTKPSAWLKMSLQSQDDRSHSSNPIELTPDLRGEPESPGPSIPPTPPPKPSRRSYPSTTGRAPTQGSRSLSRHNPPPPPLPTQSPPAQYMQQTPPPQQMAYSPPPSDKPPAPRSKYNSVKAPPRTPTERPSNEWQLSERRSQDRRPKERTSHERNPVDQQPQPRYSYEQAAQQSPYQSTRMVELPLSPPRRNAKYTPIVTSEHHVPE